MLWVEVPACWVRYMLCALVLISNMLFVFHSYCLVPSYARDHSHAACRGQVSRAVAEVFLSRRHWDWHCGRYCCTCTLPLYILNSASCCVVGVCYAKYRQENGSSGRCTSWHLQPRSADMNSSRTALSSAAYEITLSVRGVSSGCCVRISIDFYLVVAHIYFYWQIKFLYSVAILVAWIRLRMLYLLLVFYSWIASFCYENSQNCRYMCVAVT